MSPRCVLAPGLKYPYSSSKDIVVAAGLHKDIKDKYFRVGHMGVSVVDTERGDLDRVIKGIKEAFAEAGYKSS